MQTSSKKITRLLTTSFLLVFLATPVALAMECDQDGDGYIVIPNSIMKTVAPNTIYSSNADYSPAEWSNFYNIYKTADLTPDETCDGLNFKKGAEPQRCDTQIISANSNVYDPAKQPTPLQGSQVNPGALDIADNGVDENCDGKDASLIESAGQSKDLGGLSDKVLTILSQAVIFVSVVIMIYGGVMYATAAGDEAKTSKARKAIIGAVIGLLVGLLAPTVVHWIAANLG